MIFVGVKIFKEIICSVYINHVILLSLYIQCTVRSDSLQKKKKKKHISTHGYIRHEHNTQNTRKKCHTITV